MRFASLGSGSRGNATVLELNGLCVLIDCGFSVKDTERRLARLGLVPEQVKAILVTHEHSDHIRGVAPFARKHQLEVYMTSGTYRACTQQTFSNLTLIQEYRSFELLGVKVQPVAVPHDAREPTQYTFETKSRRLGILTDLGSITPHVEDHYLRCDSLILEANHDPAMLANGPYPAAVKRRIGSSWGHLSNEQCANFLGKVETAQLQNLAIAHISRKNNSLALTKEAIKPITSEVGELVFACQDEGFSWLNIV